MFGGNLGEAYDSCYHKICDDLTNISQEALKLNTQALSYATSYFAMLDEPLTELAMTEEKARTSSDKSTQAEGSNRKEAAPAQPKGDLL